MEAVATLNDQLPAVVTNQCDHAGTNLMNDSFVRTPEEPGQPLVNGTKDMEHAKSLGKALGVPLPAADVILANCKDVVERGGGELDWSSACLPVREASGLKSDKELPH